MTTVGDLLGLQGLDMAALSSSIFWAVAIICATSIIVGWFAVSGSEYMGGAGIGIFIFFIAFPALVVVPCGVVYALGGVFGWGPFTWLFGLLVPVTLALWHFISAALR